MIIKVDDEGRQVITQLCDIALKAGGLQNMESISRILSAIEILPELNLVDDIIDKEAIKDKKC